MPAKDVDLQFLDQHVFYIDIYHCSKKVARGLEIVGIYQQIALEVCDNFQNTGSYR